MLFLKRFFLVALLLSIFLSCQPKFLKQPPPPVETTFLLPDSALVTAARENVRQKPNGKILGTLRRGKTIYLDKRQGNWLQFHNQKFKRAYIWAPSAGFPYINLYNPATYFDTTKNEFYRVEYFQQLFGSPGIPRQELSTEHQLFFDEIGLGSHEEVVMEVVTETRQNVHHGITLYIHTRNQSVRQVRIDFFRPVKGIAAALRKCGLENRKPSEENEGHVLWYSGMLFPGLKINLERKEWKSNWFSTIWFQKGEVEK